MTTPFQDDPFQDDPYLSAMFAELDSLTSPLQENWEKLQDVIDRSERDGICSREVAQRSGRKSKIGVSNWAFCFIGQFASIRA
jgi:hypothetical protein